MYADDLWITVLFRLDVHKFGSDDHEFLRSKHDCTYDDPDLCVGCTGRAYVYTRLPQRCSAHPHQALARSVPL